jgi:hypothetical protein
MVAPLHNVFYSHYLSTLISLSTDCWAFTRLVGPLVKAPNHQCKRCLKNQLQYVYRKEAWYASFNFHLWRNSWGKYNKVLSSSYRLSFHGKFRQAKNPVIFDCSKNLNLLVNIRHFYLFHKFISMMQIQCQHFMPAFCFRIFNTT